MTEEQAIESIDMAITGLNYNKKYNKDMSVDQQLIDALMIVNTLAKKEYARSLTNNIIKEMKS